MMKTHALKSVVFAAIAAGLSSVGFAAEYWASPAGGGAGTSKDDPMSLAAALAAANAAGEASTVHLAAGEYPVLEQIAPAKDVKIIGAGAGVTSLVGTDALTTANKSLLRIVQDGVEVRDLTVTNGIAATSGAGVVMTKGVLKDCRVSGCVTTEGSGGGIYINGDATVVGCEVYRCLALGRTQSGNGIKVVGGAAVISNCTVHGCRNFGSWTCANHTVSFSNGGGISLGGGTPLLTHSVITDNGNKSAAGVYQTVGTVANCLVYGNQLYGSGTFYKTGGTTVNCTIDGTHSGVFFTQTKGESYNNIIWRKDGAASCSVSGGTFATNVISKAVDLYDDNIVGDPLFADAANANYRLASSLSPAFDAGHPTALVTADLDGNLRDADAPDIGCYEYDASQEPLRLEIRVSAKDIIPEMPVTLNFVLVGAKLSDYDITWELGEEFVGETKVVTLTDLPTGYHDVNLTLVPKAGGETLTASVPQGIAVHGKVAYVGASGSATFPYDTEERATSAFSDAFDAVWKSATTEADVYVGAGTFEVTRQTVLERVVRVTGVSSNESVLVGSTLTQSMFVLKNDKSYVTSLMVTNIPSASAVGVGFNISKGRVTDCRISNCHGSGGAAYLSGGWITGCTFDHCSSDAKGNCGNAIKLYGGSASNCTCVACDGGYDWPALQYGSAIVSVQESSSKLLDCRIIGSTRGNVPGVYQELGLVANCLIVGNTGTSGGALNKKNGETYYCTIYGNQCGSTGSGIQQSGGTTKNCIIWGNGPTPDKTGSCTVTGGTFENNLIDYPVSGYADNTIGDPLFRDAANGDYHVKGGTSAAVGIGVPLASCTVDMDGVARGTETTTAGCYEFDPSSVPFDVDVRFGETVVGFGTPVTVQVSVEGGTVDDCDYAWYLDGGETPASTDPVWTIAGLAPAAHTLRLVATPKDGRDPVEKTYPDCITVWTRTVYVNHTGSGTYPYDTEAKGTNSVKEALAALWTDPQSSVEVFIGAGTFDLDAQLVFPNKATVTGAGRDATILSGYPERAVVVNREGSLVSSLTVTNCYGGFAISKGRITDCRAIRCGHDQDHVGSVGTGAGFQCSGGLVDGCEAINCSLSGATSIGAGLSQTGGTVSNCVFRGGSFSGWVHPSFGKAVGVRVSGTSAKLLDCTVEDYDGYGNASGVFVADGGAVVERCVIRNNRGLLGGGGGAAVQLADGGKVRNCLIAGNTISGSGNAPVCVNARSGITLVNCTLVDNAAAQTNLLVDASSSVYNSIISEPVEKTAFAEGATVEHCCSLALAEGVNGNTAKDPKFKSVARGDYRLKGGSPCIDAGDNSRWDGVVDPVDLDGGPRIRRGIVDMGCYEKDVMGLMLMVR